MKKYVAGLMFSEDKTKVALVRKNKPDLQKGLLNGIGGKIELEDSGYCNPDSLITESERAMIREFQEETGVLQEDWHYFLTMGNNKGNSDTDERKTQQYSECWSVDFFRCFSDKVFECKTMKDEEIEVYSVGDVIKGFNFSTISQKYTELKTIDNLKWIILLAIDQNPKFTEVKY